MRKIAFALLMTLLLSCVAVAANTYQTAKVVKWENSTYQQKKNKVGQWVVYSIQTDELPRIRSPARRKPSRRCSPATRFRSR